MVLTTPVPLQTINVNPEATGHSVTHGYITTEDEESSRIVSNLIDTITIGGKGFRAWPSPEKVARLTFKIPSTLVQQNDPKRLFSTLPYRNGWPIGQSELYSCEDDAKDPKTKIMTFLASETLVNHIRIKPLVKINMTSSYVFHNNSLVAPNTQIKFTY